MTDEKDAPVHYQVSVTGRQAAVFFLALLAALGLSFFFGMKTGAAAKRGPDAVSALAAQSDIPVPTEAAGGGGEKSTPVPTEVPIGFEPAAAKPAKAEAPAKEEPAPVVKELVAAAPVVPPARKEVAAASEKAEKPKATEAAKEEGPFWVQILVTSSPQKADALAKKLKAESFHPDVSLVPGKKGLFRVRVGSYPDRARAEAAAKKVGKVEKLQGRPIVVPGR